MGILKKRVLSICLITVLAIGCVGCGDDNSGGNPTKPNETTEIPTSNAEEPISGGWTEADSKELTKERLEVFDKAVEKEDGVHYTPIAYLASQVVAGTNHSFLCKATDVTEDAEESYMIVNIYEDLEGNAEILDVENADPDKYSDLINQAK